MERLPLPTTSTAFARKRTPWCKYLEENNETNYTFVHPTQHNNKYRIR